ncbi:MAG: tRNA-dihydrouridine synthase [archaeon]|nr:tRNA-dihydrouridine synthase [archaeon]
MWKLGNLDIDGRVVLGPMSGFTCSSYREFMRPFGTAVTVTEMISDMGVVYGGSKTAGYLEFKDNGITGVQLFGGTPEGLAMAAKKALEINPDISFFDVNMGCPVTKIIRVGAGSVLMKDPVKCGEMVRAIKKAVDVPVTAKIRLGWTNKSMNFREVIEKVTDAGVDAVTVHARTKEERYLGTPHYDLIADLQSEMSVPLIISGNIVSVESAAEAMELTGATAVMVARGGVGNPYLVTQLDRYFRTGEVLPNPTVSQQVDWCIQLADMLIAEKGDDSAMRKFRSFAPRFVAGCHGCREYRHRLATESVDYDSLVNLLNEIKEKLGSEHIFNEGRREDLPDME